MERVFFLNKSCALVLAVFDLKGKMSFSKSVFVTHQKILNVVSFYLFEIILPGHLFRFGMLLKRFIFHPPFQVIFNVLSF